MQGNLERMRARQAELGYYARAAESLSRSSGGSGSSLLSQGQFGSTSNNSNFSNYS